MSYGSIYTCTHKVDTSGTTTTYTIDILKKGYSGFPQELVGWEETFVLEYDRINVREPFKTPINQGRMEFYVAIRSSDELDLLNEVFSGEEDTHQLRLKKDGQVIWTGFILKDLLQYSNGDYPYRATIIAKDLTRLNQFIFPLSQNRQKLIVTIADLLNDIGLGLDIYTYTNWDNNSFGSEDDFLNLTYHELKALRDYGEDGDEDDAPATNQFWLDALLRNFGLILRQADGAWRIYHLSGIGSSVKQYRYNSSGVQQSSGSVDLRTTIDGSTKYLLPSSQNYYLPAIKKAQVTWDHRTQVSGIKLPTEVNLVEATSSSFTQLFLSNGEQTINFKVDIFASFPELDTLTPPANARGQIEIKIVGTSTYYLQDDLSWGTTRNTYTPTLLFRKPILGGGFDVSGSANFRTDEIPSGADGILTVTFTGALNDRDFATTTQYTSFEFKINNDTVQKNSESLGYSLTQTGNYSYNYNHGAVYFGDGPTSYSDSAFRYGTGDEDLITDGWKRDGEVATDSFFKLLLREFVDLQADGLRIIEADIYGPYSMSSILDYESGLFFPLGGSFTGNNTTRLDFLNVSYSDSGASLEESVVTGSKVIAGASSQDILNYWSTVKQSDFFNTVFLQNYVGELSVALESGSRTSLTANLSAQLRDGEDFIVVDKENEKPYFINVTANVNTGENRTVQFDEQYFPVTLPVGSPIVLSGGLLQSYFTIDPTKLKIQVDNVAGDFASLELRVDDTESSITQSVQFDNTGAYTKLIAGPEGSEFAIVADQINITGVITAINNEGSTTIDGDKITTGSITATQINVTNLFSQSISIGSSGYIQSTGYNGSNGFRINADGTAYFQKVDIGGANSSIGNGAVLQNLTVTGTLTMSGSANIDGTNYDLTATGGNIAGWIIDAGTLKSQSSGARIELNKTANRVSIFDAIGEKAVMGYLSGLERNDGGGTWGSNDYGFWAKNGDYLQIDGDMQYESGDWIVQNDASLKIFDGSDNEIVRLGTDSGNKGLFLYNTSGTKLAQYRSDAVIIGDDATTEYLKYQSGVLTVRGSLNADDITAGSISSITVATGTATISGSTPSGTGTYLDSGGRMFSGSSGAGLFVDTPNGDIYIYDYTFNDTLGANSLYHRKDLGANTSPNRAGFIHGIKYTDSGTPKWTGIAIGTGGNGDVYLAPHADDSTEFSYEFSKELIWSKANQRWEFDDDLFVGGTFTNPSDERYKENIVPLGDVLDNVLSLSTVVYDMKDFMPDDERRMIGVYAQEIEQYFPEAVVTGTFIGEDGIEREIKSVSYTQLVPVLIKAIKELNDKIG